MIRDNLPSAVTREPSGCQPETPQLPGSRQSRIPELRLRLQDPSGSTKTLQQRLGAGARHSSAGEPGRVWDTPPAKRLRLNCSLGGWLLASDEAALVQIDVEGLFSPTGQIFESFSISMIPVYSWTMSWRAFLVGVLLSVFQVHKNLRRTGKGGQGRL